MLVRNGHTKLREQNKNMDSKFGFDEENISSTYIGLNANAKSTPMSSKLAEILLNLRANESEDGHTSCAEQSSTTTEQSTAYLTVEASTLHVEVECLSLHSICQLYFP